MNDKFFDSSWYEEGNVQPPGSLVPGALVAVWLAATDGLAGELNRSLPKPSDAFAEMDGRLLLEDVVVTRHKVVAKIADSDTFWEHLRDAGGGNAFDAPDTWMFADEMAEWLTKEFPPPRRAQGQFKRVLREGKKGTLLPETLSRLVGRLTPEQTKELVSATALHMGALPDVFVHELAQCLGVHAREGVPGLLRVALSSAEQGPRRMAAVECLGELGASDALAEIVIALEHTDDDAQNFTDSILWHATKVLSQQVVGGKNSPRRHLTEIKRCAERLLDSKPQWPWLSVLYLLTELGDEQSLAILESRAVALESRAPKGTTPVIDFIKRMRRRLRRF